MPPKRAKQLRDPSSQLNRAQVSTHQLQSALKITPISPSPRTSGRAKVHWQGDENQPPNQSPPALSSSQTPPASVTTQVACVTPVQTAMRQVRTTPVSARSRRVHPAPAASTINTPPHSQPPPVDYRVFESPAARKVLKFDTPPLAAAPVNVALPSILIRPFELGRTTSLPKNRCLRFDSGHPMTIDAAGARLVLKRLFHTLKHGPDALIHLDGANMRFLFAAIRGLDEGLQVEIRHIVVLKGFKRLGQYQFSLDRYFSSIDRVRKAQHDKTDIVIEVALRLMGSDLMLVELVMNRLGDVLSLASPLSISVGRYGLHFSPMKANPVEAILKHYGRDLRAFFREFVMQCRLSSMNRVIRFFYFLHRAEPLWATAHEGVLSRLVMEMSQALVASSLFVLDQVPEEIPAWQFEQGRQCVRSFLISATGTLFNREFFGLMMSVMDRPQQALPGIWNDKDSTGAQVALSSAYHFLRELFGYFNVPLLTQCLDFSSLRPDGQLMHTLALLAPLFSWDWPGDAPVPFGGIFSLVEQPPARLSKPRTEAYSPKENSARLWFMQTVSNNGAGVDSLLYYDRSREGCAVSGLLSGAPR